MVYERKQVARRWRSAAPPSLDATWSRTSRSTFENVGCHASIRGRVWHERSLILREAVCARRTIERHMDSAVPFGQATRSEQLRAGRLQKPTIHSIGSVYGAIRRHSSRARRSAVRQCDASAPEHAASRAVFVDQRRRVHGADTSARSA